MKKNIYPVQRLQRQSSALKSRVNTVTVLPKHSHLVPEDTNISLCKPFDPFQFTIVLVFKCNIDSNSLFCFYTFSMKCPLLRSSSLQPSPALKNLYSRTPAQQTTQTMRLPFPSQSRRQLYPAYLCGNNHWKREGRGRKRERK